ncbi:hypothetical protein, partial [Escherichia coli]|uniref:hypothetical protein n=1 Tax=Escherichia coli TaxID=562 RepID=UPI00208DD5AC
GERTIADATAAQHKTGLLQEIFFLPHRQFVLLRQFDRCRRAEILTGARKTYGLNLIGGIRRDLLKDDMIQTRQLAQQMRREV